MVSKLEIAPSLQVELNIDDCQNPSGFGWMFSLIFKGNDPPILKSWKILILCNYHDDLNDNIIGDLDNSVDGSVSSSGHSEGEKELCECQTPCVNLKQL